MNASLDTIAGHLQGWGCPGVLGQVLVESALLLGLAGLACLLCRRTAAATRHLIWFLAMSSLPVLLGIALLPRSSVRPVWSVSTGFDLGNQFVLGLRFGARPGPAQPARAVSRGEHASTRAPVNAVRESGFLMHVSPRWLVLGAMLWAGGVLAGGLTILAGLVRLRGISRSAVLLDTAEWRGLLEESCRALGVRRVPILQQSAQQLMPMTWGWWLPRILLPAAAEEWPVQTQRMVLLHELAHVKRRDCLTQIVARAIGALFWVNPLVWVASRRMCVERERACDDLVLSGGCRASDYAAQLLEIARSFRPARLAAGIAMARSAQIQGRIAAIIDGSRHRRPRPGAAFAVLVLLGGIVACLAATGGKAPAEPAEDTALARHQLAQIQAFARAKEKQSEALAAKAGETIAPDFQQYFQAAVDGDIQAVTNRYEYFKQHHPQYGGPGRATNTVARLRTPYWQPVLEICLACDQVANCEPKYTQILADGIIESGPRGSIYFGGTDPGRGVPTAFEKSSIEGDPFYVVTQNAFADATYLDYLRSMYEGKIYTPSAQDSQQCFQEYLADAQRRLQEHRLKPGEDVQVSENRVSVSGQVAVMSINALLAKVVFDRNPDREFYIEESFPLDWMYPYLEPHGLIMKINRAPQAQLTEEVLTKDREYWGRLVTGMIGTSMHDLPRVADVAAFVERVYVRKDLNGFAGDPRYIRNDYSKRIYSKLRSSIAGVYAWRLGTNAPPEFKPSTDDTQRELVHDTDLAYRQAFALCPYSPEAVFRYSNFLVQFGRIADARLLVQAALKTAPKSAQFQDLLQNLDTYVRQK